MMGRKQMTEHKRNDGRRQRNVFCAKCCASYTVEAVFVVPFITMLVVLMIDMTMYLRDLGAAEALADRIAEETRALVLNDEDPELGKIRYERKFQRSIFARWFAGSDAEDAKEMTQRLRDQAEGRFWICKVQDAYVSVGGDEVCVHMKIAGNSILPMFGRMTEQWFDDNITRKISCRNTRQRTRIYSAIMETGSQIKGVSTVLEKLSQLVNRLGQ
ncbi:MAG: hypothetical protein IKX54_00355 [Lachnospiraceae bacterium]|nr:hypothetical protein [Lachnospiraceae bacterium]